MIKMLSENRELVMLAVAIVLLLMFNPPVKANQFGHSPASPVGEAVRRNHTRDLIRDDRRGVNTLDSQQGQRADVIEGKAGQGGEGHPTAIIKFEPVPADFWQRHQVPERQFRRVPPVYNEMPWHDQ